MVRQRKQRVDVQSQTFPASFSISLVVSFGTKRSSSKVAHRPICTLRQDAVGREMVHGPPTCHDVVTLMVFKRMR
jgi:hypothetical protein